MLLFCNPHCLQMVARLLRFTRNIQNENWSMQWYHLETSLEVRFSFGFHIVIDCVSPSNLKVEMKRLAWHSKILKFQLFGRKAKWCDDLLRDKDGVSKFRREDNEQSTRPSCVQTEIEKPFTEQLYKIPKVRKYWCCRNVDSNWRSFILGYASKISGMQNTTARLF